MGTEQEREKGRIRTAKWRTLNVDRERRHFENVIRSAKRRKLGTIDGASHLLLLLTRMLLCAQCAEAKSLGLMEKDYCAYLEPMGSIQRLCFGEIVHLECSARGRVDWVLFQAHDNRMRLRAATKKNKTLPRLVAVSAENVSIVPNSFPRDFDSLSARIQRDVIYKALGELVRRGRVANQWRPVWKHTKLARRRRPIGPKKQLKKRNA